jgi:recombination protein RecR
VNDNKNKLIEYFQKFPGIGPKQAQRFVYFLMKQNKRYIDDLTKNIESLKQNSFECIECHAFYSIEKQNKNNICNICGSENRDKSQIIIVEKELDVDAIEKTNEYNGTYFVMGGRLPFLSANPTENIKIRELVEKIRRQLDLHNLTEIIFALPATDEGDYEMEYIRKTISQIVGIKEVKISSLARGVSTGLEMEYVDHDTFKNAFSGRK